MILVAVQLSLTGLYLPPVLRKSPPQTIISLPVQTALRPLRPSGALIVLVSVQLSVMGSYLPPALPPPLPPQTIISLPVQTAAWNDRASGALKVSVEVHVSSVHPPEGVAITGSW